MMKAIQYTPWIDCSTGCKFCTNRNCKDVDKAENLRRIINLLDDPEVDNYDCIGLIGGEFFQSQLNDPIVEDLWFEMIDKINSKPIKQFWLATSLICKRSVLDRHISYLRAIGLINKTLLCTSYDVVYRFTHTKLANWESNMEFLHEKFPELRIHTEMIATQAFISALAIDANVKLPYMLTQIKPLNLQQFERRYHTVVDFIEPHTGFQNIDDFMIELPMFLPRRATFLSFLTNIADKWDLNRINSFLNPRIRSATIYHIQNGKLVKIEDRWNKRLENQAIGIKPLVGYCDSNVSIIDDVNLWREKYD